jgi:hypothetical protein
MGHTQTRDQQVPEVSTHGPAVPASGHQRPHLARHSGHRAGPGGDPGPASRGRPAGARRMSPAEPTPSPPPTPPGPPATRSRIAPQTGTGTDELPDTVATPRWSPWAPTAVPRSSAMAAQAAPASSGWPQQRAPCMAPHSHDRRMRLLGATLGANETNNLAARRTRTDNV